MKSTRRFRTASLVVAAGLIVAGCGSRAPEAARLRARGLAQLGATGQQSAGAGASPGVQTATGGENPASAGVGAAAAAPAGSSAVAGAPSIGASTGVDRAASAAPAGGNGGATD